MRDEWKWGKFSLSLSLCRQAIHRSQEIEMKYILVTFLTDNVKVTQPGLCFGRVDLAHVCSLVWTLNIADVKVPGASTFLADRHPRVSSDDMILNSQNGWTVIVYPGYLKHGSKVS